MDNWHKQVLIKTNGLLIQMGSNKYDGKNNTCIK